MRTGAQIQPSRYRKDLGQAACTCWQGNRRATTCITCLRWQRLQAHVHAMREGLRSLTREGA
jgi:hypothetical protein